MGMMVALRMKFAATSGMDDEGMGMMARWRATASCGPKIDGPVPALRHKGAVCADLLLTRPFVVPQRFCIVSECTKGNGRDYVGKWTMATKLGAGRASRSGG